MKTCTNSSNKARKRKRRESYTNFIFKVLEKNYPGQRLSTSSLKVMNSFILNIFNGVAKEASSLAHNNNTVTTHEIQEAVKLLLPSELAKTAMQIGQQAIRNRNNNNNNNNSNNNSDNSNVNDYTSTLKC